MRARALVRENGVVDDPSTYSREDLLAAWLAAEAGWGMHPDLADYYYRRAWAMSHAFGGWGPDGTGFRECPPKHRLIWTVFESTVKQFNQSRSPWRHFIHGQPTSEYVELQTRHGRAIDAADIALQTAYRALLLDLMERMWGIGPEHRVSRDALREHGFDPDTPEPDFSLYE
jgi:hypothetical protein